MPTMSRLGSLAVAFLGGDVLVFFGVVLKGNVPLSLGLIVHRGETYSPP